MNKSIPPGLFGGMSLLAAGCMICLPETKGTNLPEDLDEARAGPLHTFCCFNDSPSTLRKDSDEESDKSEKLMWIKTGKHQKLAARV